MKNQSEYVSDIMDSGRHLLSLINDILDLSKIEAGKMEFEMSPVNSGRNSQQQPHHGEGEGPCPPH